MHFPWIGAQCALIVFYLELRSLFHKRVHTKSSLWDCFCLLEMYGLCLACEIYCPIPQDRVGISYRKRFFPFGEFIKINIQERQNLLAHMTYLITWQIGHTLRLLVKCRIPILLSWLMQLTLLPVIEQGFSVKFAID